MPKDVSERIIDSPFALTTRGGSVSIGGGGGGGGGGATNLDALTDVTVSAPSNGQTLAYNSGSGQWVNATPAAMTAHTLSGSFHTGTLNWSLVNTAGSNLTDITTRLHSDLQGMTPNDHHDHVHPLIGTDSDGIMQHTATGLTTGNVVRATAPTTFAWGQLKHTELDPTSILPDQHHPWVHDIITGAPIFGVAHTVVGADYTVVGVHPANTLAILPTSNAPGAAISVLRTDANGGIQLDTNLLYVDGANNRIGVNVTPGAGPAGGAAALDILAFANADHTQRIRQKSGQTGRLWRIENTAGHELIVMDSDGSLMSGNPLFVSGLAGWNITPEGNAEFNNIWARGELHATVFVKDEVHATGGSLLVATAGVLHDDAVINSTLVDDDVLVVYSTPAGQGVPLQVVTTSGTFTGNELHVAWVGNLININDPPSGPAFYFQPGDIIRSKTEVATGVTDFWLEVNAATQYSGYSTYSVTKRSGTDGTLPKGSAVVSYGKEGDGRILLTSDLQFAPYIDVFTTGTNVWTGAAGAVKERMRMGRLDGIKVSGVQGIEQYGMIAGKDLTDANTGYFIASNLQFSLYKIDIRLNNGTNDTGLWTADGNLRIGKNVGADATTGFRVFTTDGGGGLSGDVIIGNVAANNYIKWDQLNGTLIVRGNVIVQDPGTTVTLAQVTLLDDQVRSDAQGYAGTAQTNSITYSDARRIIGVNGSWYSPGTNRVSWGTAGTPTGSGGTALAVVFANPNTTRAINDPNAPGYLTIAARTYFYVSMAGTGTMTMQTTTSIATVSAANNVLIAVCDPGDPAAPAAARLASITVVAGSTYVSGGNIFTGSITAGNIAAGTITANKLDAATLNVTYLDPIEADVVTAQTTANTANTAAGAAQSTANTANTAAGTAQTTANSANTAAGAAQTAANNAQDAADAAAVAAATNKTYGDQRRLLNVSGTWTATNGNTISWASLQANFASGGARTITAQTGVVLGSATVPGRWYLYVDVGSGTGTMAMQTPTQTLSTLGLNDVLIAVVDTVSSASGPTPKASINVVAGSTYISGGNIQTGSINTASLAAGAITAGLINVANLAAVATTTGSLTVDNIITIGATSGNMQTSGKTSYSDGTAGIFLGYDSTGVAGHKFAVGDTNNYLRWGGAGLSVEIKSAGGVSIIASAVSPFNVMSFFRGAGPGVIRLYQEADVIRQSRIRSDGVFAFDFELYADKLINTGATFWMAQQQRAVATTTDAGFAGEMCWAVVAGTPYIYLCIATNTWRRVALSGW